MARPRKVKQPVSGQQNFVRTVTGHPPRASVAGVISLTSWPFPLWSKVVRPDRDRPSPLARTLIAVWRPKKRGVRSENKEEIILGGLSGIEGGREGSH